MQNRRDFLKTAALAAFSSGLVARQALAGQYANDLRRDGANIT